MFKTKHIITTVLHLDFELYSLHYVFLSQKNLILLLKADGLRFQNLNDQKKILPSEVYMYYKFGPKIWMEVFHEHFLYWVLGLR